MRRELKYRLGPHLRNGPETDRDWSPVADCLRSVLSLLTNSVQQVRLPL